MAERKRRELYLARKRGRQDGQETNYGQGRETSDLGREDRDRVCLEP